MAVDDGERTGAGGRWRGAEAVELLRQLRLGSLVDEAAEAARGRRAVTVVHGGFDSDGEAAAIDDLIAGARERAGAVTVRGGQDYTTILVDGPGADGVVEEVAREAAQHARRYPWWRVTLTSRPEAS